MLQELSTHRNSCITHVGEDNKLDAKGRQ